MKYLSHEGETTHKQRNRVGFGVHDRKGRELGVVIITMQVNQLPGPLVRPAHTLPGGFVIPEEYSGTNLLQPGVYFCWLGCATRAGDMFGASQSRHYCKTEAERDKQIAAYVRNARARAERRSALETATIKE